jgi:hypothetical protein
MTATKTNRMKALAVGAAMTLVLGAGATVLFAPSASAAVATHVADDTPGHVRHSGTDDTAVPMTRSGTSAAAAAQSARPGGVSAPLSGTSATAVPMWRTFVLGFIVAVIASVLLIGLAETVTRTADMVRKSVRRREQVLTS